jgi:hypothetical protein
VSPCGWREADRVDLARRHLTPSQGALLLLEATTDPVVYSIILAVSFYFFMLSRVRELLVGGARETLGASTGVCAAWLFENCCL